ncbi:protein kinase [Streptomyces sp. NPDC102270]|uniref:protein kinase domain-containing protein n=1 Tax=Streptomyces sp. NPDC102270 TaxID=3366150 RepID=UPI00381F8E06
MGRVWRAADEMLDRQVAVKEMRIDGLDAEDTRTRRERTLREARATARIDHPNVVRVYDVVDEGERLWIVMELVNGRSLERMTVEDGPLGPRETALLGLGLVRALRQVHARGVLHRDIKPGNVLVESGERTARRIVLTDFGIAAMQDAEALTMVGMLVGSPDYMAPERVSGRPQGPPSDIWSLGATLCAALGGRSPFSRDTTLATLHAVLYEEPELPAAAGPLTELLTALLEKDPSIRPGLDEVESTLHTVAFPAPTPTLRMGTGDDAGDTGTSERVPRVGGVQAPGSDQADSAQVAGAGQVDGDPLSGAAPGSERAGSSAPAWAQGELSGPRDPRGPGTSGATGVPGTAGAPGTPGGSGASEARGADEAGGAGEGSERPGASGVPGESEVPGDPGTPGASRDARGNSPEATGMPSGSTDTSTARQGSSKTPPVPGPWTPRESPTPAYLETGVVRAARDPRVPEPDAGPEAAVDEPADVEPADAVPGFSGAGVARASDSTPEESRSAAEAAWGSSTSPEEARSDAEDAEQSDGVVPRRGSSEWAGTGTGAGGVGPDGAGDDAVAARPEHPTPAGPFLPSGSQEASADHVASASTEAASEERSEVRSEAPSGSSVGAVLRAGAATTSTPLASAPTQDSLAAGAPTEHFPMPDAPTRDALTRAASAPTRVGPVPKTHRRPHHPGQDPDPAPEQGRPAQEGAAGGGPGIDNDDPATDPLTRPHPGQDPAPRPGQGPVQEGDGDSGPGIDAADPDPDPGPALVLGPHPHRIPPGEPPATAHRGRRRTTLVAVGSVVAAGVAVVAIILATTSGPPGDDKAGGSPSASASASVSSSAPGGTPSATVEGTSRPRSLPPGAHEEAGGFAWATPTGWRRDVKTGAEVHYTSPDGKQELAAKSSLARGDLMETWRTSEQNAHQGQDYAKIRLEETTFRDHPAVVWEYTFTLGGVPWHAQLLGFDVGDKSYQINTWYQPDIETQALTTYEKVKDSFTVL